MYVYKYIIVACFAGFCWLYPNTSSGQMVKDHIDNLYRIADQIKSLSVYGYSYMITEQYPDKSCDTVNGELQIDLDNRIMYNRCDEFDLICTEEWFYRATHSSKEVTIFKLSDRYNKEEKMAFIEQAFSSQLAKEFIDSVILKSARLKDVDINKDIISLKMTFPKKVIVVNEVHLKYNMKKKWPVEIVYFMIHSSGTPAYTQDESNYESIFQTIRCTNYTTQVNQGIKDDFFIVRNGKIVLRKFKDYKLITL